MFFQHAKHGNIRSLTAAYKASYGDKWTEELSKAKLAADPKVHKYVLLQYVRNANGVGTHKLLLYSNDTFGNIRNHLRDDWVIPALREY